MRNIIPFTLLAFLLGCGTPAQQAAQLSDAQGACTNDEGVTVLLAGLVPVVGASLDSLITTTCARIAATPVPVPPVPAGNTPPVTVTVTPTVPAKS